MKENYASGIVASVCCHLLNERVGIFPHLLKASDHWVSQYFPRSDMNCSMRSSPFRQAKATATTGFSATIGILSASPSVNNTSPADLNVSAPLTFAENQPVGTIVGEFNATDPDVYATLTYYLVRAGDGNNSFFTLDTNGTLRTATTFDYETKCLDLFYTSTSQGRVQRIQSKVILL